MSKGWDNFYMCLLAMVCVYRHWPDVCSNVSFSLPNMWKVQQQLNHLKVK